MVFAKTHFSKSNCILLCKLMIYLHGILQVYDEIKAFMFLTEPAIQYINMQFQHISMFFK